MADRSFVSSLTLQYNDFLFAPICEEPSGIRLSVLSAFARMNVDPWEEATRLAAMPRAIAEKTLASMLDLIPGRNWKSSEGEAIAARLVQLLPQRVGSAPPMAGARIGAQRPAYWLIWLGFAIAVSFLTPHYQATAPDAGASTSKSGVTSTLKSVGTNTTSPGGAENH
ncbi:MAG TPA: hypothetical protein VFX37_01570 [Pseudolabrys sp.]|nr:hypothetical protein [Pseudolabrys sp.]